MSEAEVARLLLRRQRLRLRRDTLSSAIAELDARIGEGMAQTLGRCPRLSRRETEVLRLVQQCRMNKEIAETLHLSVRGVKFHVSNLLAKFGVTSRRELAQASITGIARGAGA